MDILNSLFEAKDEKYKAFQEKLVPNIDPSIILGVRTPALRRIAKEVYISPEKDSFLKSLPHRYYEENLVHIFVLSMIKDFSLCIKGIEEFLPFMDCWPISDQGSPRVFKRNHERLLPYIKKWISSSHTYTARFGIRMLMNEFLDDDFKPEYLDIVSNKRGEDYYLKMMIAWYFATALAKKYESTIPYFEENKLEVWVHNKAIQKAIESYRVSDSHKEYLRGLKR